jgi:hypothetical protein
VSQTNQETIFTSHPTLLQRGILFLGGGVFPFPSIVFAFHTLVPLKTQSKLCQGQAGEDAGAVSFCGDMHTPGPRCRELLSACPQDPR